MRKTKQALLRLLLIFVLLAGYSTAHAEKKVFVIVCCDGTKYRVTVDTESYANQMDIWNYLTQTGLILCKCDNFLVREYDETQDYFDTPPGVEEP